MTGLSYRVQTLLVLAPHQDENGRQSSGYMDSYVTTPPETFGELYVTGPPERFW
jgi:hypothetical protein